MPPPSTLLRPPTSTSSRRPLHRPNSSRTRRRTTGASLRTTLPSPLSPHPALPPPPPSPPSSTLNPSSARTRDRTPGRPPRSKSSAAFPTSSPSRTSATPALVVRPSRVLARVDGPALHLASWRWRGVRLRRREGGSELGKRRVGYSGAWGGKGRRGRDVYSGTSCMLLFIIRILEVVCCRSCCSPLELLLSRCRALFVSTAPPVLAPSKSRLRTIGLLAKHTSSPLRSTISLSFCFYC